MLLDLSMPGMNGWETLAVLRKYRSDIPEVLTSGFNESHVMSGTHSDSPHAFLQKPYQSKELLRAIETAMQTYLRKGEQSGQHSSLQSTLIGIVFQKAMG